MTDPGNPFGKAPLQAALTTAVDVARAALETLGFDPEAIILVASVRHPGFDGVMCSAACHPEGDWDSHVTLAKEAVAVFSEYARHA